MGGDFIVALRLFTLLVFTFVDFKWHYCRYNHDIQGDKEKMKKEKKNRMRFYVLGGD